MMRRLNFFMFIISMLFLISCKEKGQKDFEKIERDFKFKTVDTIWKDERQKAYLLIKDENPEERGLRSWFELSVEKKNGKCINYIYYYINMSYEGIKNDTLLIADFKNETNSYIPSACWYFVDSAKQLYYPIDEKFMSGLDSGQNVNIKRKMSLINLNKKGVFKVDKDGSIEKLNISYENFNLNMININKCHECLFYFNMSRKLSKYYYLPEIIKNIQNADLKIILPTFIKEGLSESFKRKE